MSETSSTLPYDQFLEALAHKASNRFIVGVIKHEWKMILLMSGDKECIAVNFSMFQPSGTPPNQTFPDFTKFEIIDHGHGIRFGEYEAASTAIIEEFRQQVAKGLAAIKHCYDDDDGDLLDPY